jgi:rRNA maturation RNase YbeY
MISFSYQTEDFYLSDPGRLKKWLKQSIQAEGKLTGEIHFVLCSDSYLYKINNKYLKHNTLTDIITFPNSANPSIISGDIFISIERVRENASTLHITIEDELSRVLIHGILHLIGYNDHSKAEKLQMRAKEDYYLHLQP